MNTAMKQRLVGTAILGSLAIIFIPILLDGEGVSPPERTATIPEAPPLAKVPEINPVRVDINADTITPTLTQDTIDNEVPPAPEQPRLTTAGVPETWSVRLGSFGDMANAEALVKRLRDSGYKGYTRPLDTSRGVFTGVYVGPVLTESAAGSLQAELAQAFELEGAVVPFTIDELDQ